MLHILLIVLKIIGIILLAILGILILSLCVVLFVPLRYKVDASFGGDLKKSEVEVKFSWLLHLVSGRITYLNEKFDYKIRALWKKIPGTAEDSGKKDEPIEEPVKPVSTLETKSKVKVKSAKKKKDTEISKKETGSTEKETKQTKKAKESKFDKLKCTIKNVCDKIKMVVEFIKAEAHQATLLKLKQEIVRLLVSLKPKKLKGNVHFGMEDPYKTGQILAILSILYPFYGENVEIYPDFEQKVLEGKLHIKGHVRGIHALVFVIRLLFDRNIRTTIKDIKALF